MANIKISELKEQSSPSTSAALVGIDNGVTVRIPMSAVVGDASSVEVSDTTPTSATTYYPLYATDTSGAQKVRANKDLYYYDSGTWSYFNVGSSSQKGGLTLHQDNGKYANLATGTLTANRDLTIPDVSGTIITTGNFPKADENTLGGVKVKLNGTTLEISTT